MIKDARGYDLKVGDEVAFNHPCGFRKREMFIGTIILFDRYVVIKLPNGTTVDKYSSSLYKLYKEEK